ncbi:MAG TPA: hypothetical protein VH164_08095, partial [Ktedonobacteraceae bacterium]|nr:hypothetical protein [Ktedonobacteraceae bacterium]
SRFALLVAASFSPSFFARIGVAWARPGHTISCKKFGEIEAATRRANLETVTTHLTALTKKPYNTSKSESPAKN